ncbi:MAG: TPM domain-containing protein [Clostridia bacterium]
MLATQDDDGYFLQGSGLERNLSSGDLADLVDQYLMPYFNRQDYDTGSRALFDALFDKVSSIYNTGLSAPASAEPTTTPDPFAWLSPSPDAYYGGNTSRDNPAPLGDTVSWGNSENGETIRYFELSIEQILRGKDAMELIKQRYKDNDIPPEGKEYIYLNLKVRGQAKDSSQRFGFSAWEAELVSERGNIYEQCTPFGLERSAKFFAGASGNIEITAFIDPYDRPLILYNDFAWMATE